ncbi:MAG: DNA-3-methyladenine glycosylase 2 family protein [Gemmataceae bacterium]|nr:DNA-3-methyladenine glycosylase 2 family protein [Gemmataceae bacterium]
MNAYYSKAQRHLAKRCPTMKSIIERVGPCQLTPRPDEPLALLVRCVISQQISTKAADSIHGRLAEKAKAPPFTVAKLRKLAESDYRECGLSGGKFRAIQAILDRIDSDRAFLKALPTLDDDAFRASVTSIKGLGPWSADMLLMFGFGRPDVLPVGDLGIKLAIQDLWKMDKLPTAAEMHAIAEPWRPYRTVASWYLWRTRDDSW